jgi:purine nucleoside phosphorylase
MVCFRRVGGVPMGDDDEIELEDGIQSFYGTKGLGHLKMDDAFCLRMREAIAAGLENAPVGVNTTPGTQNPTLAGRYGALLPQPPSSLDD